jgi:hypothetical protein
VLQIDLTVQHPDVIDNLTVSGWSSLCFTEMAFAGSLPAEINLDNYTLSITYRKTISNLVGHVNTNGGWTVLGWHRTPTQHPFAFSIALPTIPATFCNVSHSNLLVQAQLTTPMSSGLPAHFRFKCSKKNITNVRTLPRGISFLYLRGPLFSINPRPHAFHSRALLGGS